MEQLKGLYFFYMSAGQYSSDYCIGGLYVTNKPVTEEEWHEFCKKESEIRESKRKEIITAHQAYGSSSDLYYQKHKEYWNWHNSRGSYEEMFVKLHGLISVDATELHLNY
jgi:hypothetical protein